MQPQKKTANNGKFVSFLIKNRWLITSIAIVVILLLTGIQGYNSFIESKNKSAAIELEKITETLGTWYFESDTDKKETKEKELVDKLNKIISDYKNTFAEQKAYNLLGEIFFVKKDWEKASEYYKSASSLKNNYLSVISLNNLAVCLENLGKNQEALDTYKKIVSSDFKPLIPRALFNVARLLESEGKKDEAIEKYKELTEKFTTSLWSKIAKQRLLSLEINS